jgi:D-tyrosyl-tRNA(Tyr) deacylase
VVVVRAGAGVSTTLAGARCSTNCDLGQTVGVRAVIQRVLRASVSVDGVVVGAIEEPGLLVYLGVTHGDGAEEIGWLARKVWELRLLRDEQSALDVGAPILVISQFTLYGDARKGRRPTWQAAAPGPVSEPAYDAVCAELERLGAHVERGVFGADMRVASVNDGPVTLILDKEPATAPEGP